MDELENQLNSIEDAGVEAGNQPQTADSNTDNIQQDTPEPDKPSDAQVESWKQTKQFEQGFWKTPDDIFKTVKYYEQKYQPLEQAIKKMGFNTLEDLEHAFKDYNEKLPLYQENEQAVNLLNALLQDENYGGKLRATFDEIRRAQETARYGIAFDQLPANIQERVQKGEQAFRELEELKQKQAYETNLNTINSQVEQIEKVAQEYGFDANIPEFIAYCRDNNINPANMYGEFLKTSFAQLVEKAKQGASLATAAKNKQNKAHSINSSTKNSIEPPKSINSIQDLEGAILEKL